jgi:hypothetical protein
MATAIDEHIYALVDKKSRLVRYVGRTSQEIGERWEQHKGEARRGKNMRPVYAWLRRIRCGAFVVLLQTVPRAQASAAELKWIKRFERYLLDTQFVDRSARAYKALVNK